MHDFNDRRVAAIVDSQRVVQRRQAQGKLDFDPSLAPP
jgi:hypothetical protein